MKISLLLLAAFVNPALAQPPATCEGLYPGRIVTCTELLRQQQSPDKLVKILINRAQAYQNWSLQYELAVRDYDAALGIDPDNIEALYGRGWTLESMQRYDRALADADHLIAIGDKTNKYAIQQLRCRALAGLGRLSE